MMGGALGLAVLASLAASRTSHLLASGEGHAHRADRRLPCRAFLVGAVFAVAAASIGAVFLHSGAAAGSERGRESPNALAA